jgi:hypothetical protein
MAAWNATLALDYSRQAEKINRPFHCGGPLPPLQNPAQAAYIATHRITVLLTCWTSLWRQTSVRPVRVERTALAENHA